MKEYTIAITGASGVVYGVRLIEKLLELNNKINVIVSNSGKIVLEEEMDFKYQNDKELFKINFLSFFKDNNNLCYYEIDDMMAPIASGSHKTDCMVVIPCSMSTLAAINNGLSKNLLERAADVTMKEGRKLILVPRETPFNTIHLKNMMELSQWGVKILPAMPGFYNNPTTLDDIISFIVGKTMDLMGIENDVYKRWAGQ
ncbi:putative aromatic acid decarboxylase [Oxobacter pfennigii]|uniref:Flavin prenyltransferase UbiX n=1 Tax=Oxobacter pfennigii TaxID=36849 RepID=A0A0P9AD58_9CLOT|nr:flavin prenyltransferase UbiX [Oxobacter pfennigii]KPU43041.1 putative aromatic acid decarboxylase [Oxobacter pfennigii]